jgi:hypothetical protein
VMWGVFEAVLNTENTEENTRTQRRRGVLEELRGRQDFAKSGAFIGCQQNDASSGLAGAGCGGTATGAIYSEVMARITIRRIGPCAPITRIFSMSAVRLDPVIRQT